MSRNSPPDTLTYETGGGAGSQEVIDRSSLLPISPRSAADLSAAKLGSKRRLKPIITGRPVAPATFWHARALARLRSTGFSHRTAFPALVAASIRSEWVLVEVAMRTASIEASAMIASLLRVSAPYSAASFAAASLDIGNSDQLAARIGRDSLGVDMADAAGAEKTNFEHASSSWSGLAPRNGCALTTGPVIGGPCAPSKARRPRHTATRKAYFPATVTIRP